jgi:YD repeat-containing protein
MGWTKSRFNELNQLVAARGYDIEAGCWPALHNKYRYNEHGDQIFAEYCSYESGVFNSDGFSVKEEHTWRVNATTEYRYDDRNRVVFAKTVETRTLRGKNQDQMIETMEYEYDSNGNVIYERCECDYGNDDKRVEETRRQFDDHNNLIFEKRGPYAYAYTHVYDQDGIIQETIVYSISMDGNMTALKKRIYERGKCVRVVSIRSGDVIEENRYDESGNLVHTRSDDGFAIWYIYDSRGNCVAETDYEEEYNAWLAEYDEAIGWANL